MDDLADVIAKYRKGRDGFDALALEATRLYLAGELLAPTEKEIPLADRLRALTVAQLQHALGGNLGAVPMTRDEYDAVLTDIVCFLKEWLATSE